MSSTCVYCGASIRNEKSKEHIIPNALGGQFTADNICCKQCNSLLGTSIDDPFVHYFDPILSQLPYLLKNRNSHYKPEYDVIVKYHDKYYDGRAIRGNLFSCKTLGKELGCDIRKLDPVPEIYAVKFLLDNVAFNQGLRKIAFNYALMENIDIRYLRSGLQITNQIDKKDISFNYPVIPFFPVDFFEYQLELAPIRELFHGMILFTQRNQLWCYIDLFNTFQVYVLLSTIWDGADFYYSDYQYIEKDIDWVDRLSLCRDADIALLAEQYHVKRTTDRKEMRRRIKDSIRRQPMKVSLAKVIGDMLQQYFLSVNVLASGQFMKGNHMFMYGIPECLYFYFDHDHHLLDKRFRALTPYCFRQNPYLSVSYPVNMQEQLAEGIIPTQYTYPKFHRLTKYIRQYKASS